MHVALDEERENRAKDVNRSGTTTTTTSADSTVRRERPERWTHLDQMVGEGVSHWTSLHAMTRSRLWTRCIRGIP